MARRSSEVCRTSGQQPGLGEELAAPARLLLALCRRGRTSTHPVNRFFSFHSLWPCRSSTSVPTVMPRNPARSVAAAGTLPGDAGA